MVWRMATPAAIAQYWCVVSIPTAGMKVVLAQIGVGLLEKAVLEKTVLLDLKLVP